ncbi:MAG: hypothetical protein KGQ36_02295 [Rickettsiales bacterium]|nr:hypothetical protein [Rickettsiales bacterium]
MSKQHPSSQNKINPKEVKWRYFYKNADGTVGFTEDETQVADDLNKVTVLTTSLAFIAAPIDRTPDKMQGIVEEILAKSNKLCVALPYQEGYEKYHGVPKSPYSDIVVHDVFNPNSFIGYMSPKAGAAQIASAIEHSFDIHAMAGGVQAGQKMELVRDYFRDNPLPESHKRPILTGFSDGSEHQFGLRELVEYIHAGNAGKTFSKTWPTAKEKVQEIIEVFESKEDKHFSRDLKCRDQATYESIKSLYQEGDKIKFHTYFPRQLLSAIDSPYRPNFSGEKLILGLEGYIQSETRYNASEVLEIALQSGVIKPEQVIAVSIENIVAEEDQMDVNRFNGHIKPYDQLEESEKKKISGILVANNKDKKDEILGNERAAIEGYIERANRAYDNEAARIREVAERHGIPVVEGGKVRSGHAKNFIVQPTHVSDIEFDDLTRELRINSTIRRNERFAAMPVKVSPYEIKPKIWHEKTMVTPLLQENSAIYPNQKVTENYSYSKHSTYIAAESEKQNEMLSSLKIEPANEAACGFISGESKVIVGSVGNISERNLAELNGKGLVCIMPNRVSGKGVHQSFDIIHLLNSGRLGESEIIDSNPNYQIPFVILAAENSAMHNERTLKPLINSLDPKVPVFLASNLSQEMLKDLPSLFRGRVDLEKMQSSEVDLDKAATKIQSRVRGMQVRSGMEAEKVVNDNKRQVL